MAAAGAGTRSPVPDRVLDVDAGVGAADTAQSVVRPPRTASLSEPDVLESLDVRIRALVSASRSWF